MEEGVLLSGVDGLVVGTTGGVWGGVVVAVVEERTHR